MEVVISLSFIYIVPICYNAYLLVGVYPGYVSCLSLFLDPDHSSNIHFNRTPDFSVWKNGPPSHISILFWWTFRLLRGLLITSQDIELGKLNEFYYRFHSIREIWTERNIYEAKTCKISFVSIYDRTFLNVE